MSKKKAPSKKRNASKGDDDDNNNNNEKAAPPAKAAKEAQPPKADKRSASPLKTVAKQLKKSKGGSGMLFPIGLLVCCLAFFTPLRI